MEAEIQKIVDIEVEQELPAEFRVRLERAIASAVEQAIDQVLDDFEPAQWAEDNLEFQPPF